MRTGFETEFLRISHDATHQVLELEWLDFTTSVQLREGMMKGLQLAEQFRVKAWLGNLRKMRVIRPLDQQWLYEEWFPRFAALGIRRLAVVESDDSLNRMGVAQIMRHSEGLLPLATAYFPCVEAARTWARNWFDESVVWLTAPTPARIPHRRNR